MGVAGIKISDHRITSPPDIAIEATKVLQKIGAISTNANDIAFFRHLYTSPITLAVTNVVLQGLGIDVAAISLKKRQQHLHQIPFAILALPAAIVSTPA